jgi:outer membrane receptor protein involved in Fe transport
MADGGKVEGTVTSEAGDALAFVNVVLQGTHLGASTDVSGHYLIVNVPAAAYTVEAAAVGYRKKSASVTVADGQTAKQDFSLSEDVLNMQEVVVTGTLSPRAKQDATIAISTLDPALVTQAHPRSTTELLRYVPGFTRVESSGGEVNENISIRGILGVEYVMFMEDGLPVFPTMHTFFMNADNLFRPDENIASVEVVRGGNSALFGSNTPGAIINFINNYGGPQITGVAKTTVATKGLGRYDFDVNGPLAEDWRFNMGGFYRYDHGIRDPGFPGVAGGQFKANVTRLLTNGYVRVSAKIIDDRNQFILDLPFTNTDDPTYVPGLSDYVSMNTNEGNHIRVPIPTGELELPLDHGLKTSATWLTGDVGFNLPDHWSFQNTAQIMHDDQEWNALLPFNVLTLGDWAQDSSLGLPGMLKRGGFIPNARNATIVSYDLLFTNHFDPTGNHQAFDTRNNLLSPGGEWHVEKPISAFQDQLQLKKTVDRNTFSVGLYFANYSQTNRWYFTDILTDVRDNPYFVDVKNVVYSYPGKGQDTVRNLTNNGFRDYLSNYVNGDGTTTIFSGVAGAELQLSDQLRADLGGRYEYDDFVQTAENTSNVDLDGNPATSYDVESFGNGSFRHFSRSMDDWAASLGFNYKLSDQLSLYTQGSRAYKMPALDEFLNGSAQAQIDLLAARRTYFVEVGAKYSDPHAGIALDGFWGKLENIIGQGAEVDPVTGGTIWVTRVSPDNRAYGAELEASVASGSGLSFMGSATLLTTQTVEAAGAALTAGGIPTSLFNVTGKYSNSGFEFFADWHFVGSRDLINSNYDFTTGKFSTYDKIGELKAYHYLNLGTSYLIPGQSLTLSASLLNVYQSKGLEEGNPRLPSAGGGNIFLARPILPLRFEGSLRYQF